MKFMNRIEKLEKRWKELVGRPRSKEELEESDWLAKELELEYSKEYASMIVELADKGILIFNIYDLVNTAESYPDAIPILLDHVTKNYHDKNKEGIIRALAVKEARGIATPVLIDVYNQTPKDKMNLRWIIGNTVFMTFTDDDIESILPVVQDKTNGWSRDRFVEGLGKTKLAKDKVENVLIDLLNDEEVIPAALKALRRLKSNKAKEKISMLTSHPNDVVREEAKKTLRKIL
jgi:hypothetical protein